MATLTGEQLKDSYQSLVTIGDSITSDPTSGALENGKGTPLTAVGIGTDSPTSFLPNGRELVLGNGSASHGMTIFSDSAGTGNLFFADGTTGDEAYRGFLRYNHADDAMTIFTAGANERMRIDSSGNVGIGASDITSVGNYKVLELNGSSTNGGYLRLATSDTEQAYIASNVNGLLISSEGATYQAYFTNGSERMRILSDGGITFNGDTAQANALDDYEEGTWTATIGGTSNLTSVTEVQNKYTKIGNVVHLNISWTADVTNSTAETQIVFALPFATSDSHNDVGVVSVISGSGADRFGVGTTFRGTTSTTNVYVIIGGNQINATGSATIKTSFTYIIE